MKKVLPGNGCRIAQNAAQCYLVAAVNAKAWVSVTRPLPEGWRKAKTGSDFLHCLKELPVHEDRVGDKQDNQPHGEALLPILPEGLQKLLADFASRFHHLQGDTIGGHGGAANGHNRQAEMSQRKFSRTFQNMSKGIELPIYIEQLHTPPHRQGIKGAQGAWGADRTSSSRPSALPPLKSTPGTLHTHNTDIPLHEAHLGIKPGLESE